ncbi:MAG: hypothetical protein CVV27_06925 [Candidatus Melainabacteria bacterium HGW-Melainabacteria-1]|nr:MAG: hypothetical protein CVV27_06925 [Candidatus Melainabacteria bacterium HGW-Melainabacteria-1]
MRKENLEAWIAMPLILITGGLLALAGSDGGQSFVGLPVFGWCVLLAFGIQWLAFVPAYLGQSETYYDLTGSLTYLSVLALALGLTQNPDPRSLLLAGLCSIWAIRLGSYLFLRVRAVGEDSRFRELKTVWIRYLMAWTMQGLWVCFSLAAALAAITASAKVPLDLYALLGSLVWLLGFGIEAIADHQKSQFRKQQKAKGGFIHTGLWAWSRHPNYFGEILLWIGIALIALPQLQGMQTFCLVSPLFVIVLLTRISGIPMLEEKADKTWGGQPDYEAYKAKTPVLILKPPAGQPDN